MNATECARVAPPMALRRDAATWHGYLLLGFFTFLLNIQGNILPFLRAELALGYGTAALHSSAIALGMIVTGLGGDRVIGRLGRAAALRLGGLAAAAGAVLLCLAPTAWASIPACFLFGVGGSLLPAIVPAMLADIHGRQRDRALTELSAACYVFAVTAPLAVAGALWLDLGWRAAVLAGVVAGLLILYLGHAVVLPEGVPAGSTASRLPVTFWAYWLLLALVVAIEFSVLLWAPAYLEQVVGLRPAAAAGTAAVFPVAMLVGRLLGSGLVGWVRAPVLYVLALLVSLLGFALYWSSAMPGVAVAGLAVLGLGVALLYPLNLGLALEAAGPRGAAASARIMLAVGLAVLTAPFVLGAIADRVGLAAAHLVIPCLVLAALVVLVAARRLERGRAAGA
jgi:fucose permease